MKQQWLRELGLLCFIISVISACGRNIQNNDNAFDKEAAKNAYLQLGIEYMRHGDNKKALNPFKKALELDHNYAEAHHVIALVYEKLGKTKQARRHYQKALSLKPKDSHTLINYGSFLCKRNQWEEADKHFLKALENPAYKSPEIPYANAGLCALRNKNFTKAETYLRQALQNNPKFSRALYYMARLNYEQGRYKQASEYLQRYTNIAKHTPQTLWLGIRIEGKLNNQEAQASYERLLRNQFPFALETQKLNQLNQLNK